MPAEPAFSTGFSLRGEQREVCSPRRVDRAWLFSTHRDLLSLFEVSSQVSLKPLARQMLERSRFQKRGHCQQKREKTTWTWKPARQFRLPQKKAGPRGSGNPREIKSIPFHPFMASITPLCPGCAQGTKPGFGVFPPAPHQKKNVPNLE